MSTLLRITFLISLISLSLFACTTSPTGRSQLMIVSEDEAITASEQAYDQVIDPLAKEGKVDNDAALTKRVQTITNRLIVQAEITRPATKNWDWSVKVIDDPDVVNAWCMAGGKMAIYTGLILKIKPTDDELAQVMGHEISHALANHSAERMSRAMATALGISILGMTVDDDNKGLTLAGAALAAKLALELPNSRTAEAEADRMGIELAAKAGYDPHAAVTLWQKMEKVGGNGVPEFLSTHPAPANRQQTLESLIPEMMPYYEAAKKREAKTAQP
ncbi:MAG: M48 family metallopeptidase [Proteobacteria bacterium]|jgi:predicted Zn-dependent protease|nr:M48 family metallopeptidase [Pseudomonadota bacterium]